MKYLDKIVPRVPKILLFLFAAILWGFAGFKILSIGIPDMVHGWAYPIANLAVAGFIFAVFFKFVFFKLFTKHCNRIINYEQQKICMFAFFDWKGYAIMAFMISFGIILRNMHLFNPTHLGTFYTGLGVAIFGASFCFMLSFMKRAKKLIVQG